MPQQSHVNSRASTTEKAPNFHAESQKAPERWQKLTAKKRKPPGFCKQRGRPAVSPFGEGAASGVTQSCANCLEASNPSLPVEGVASGGKKKKTAGVSPTASERQLAIWDIDVWPPVNIAPMLEARAKHFRRVSLQWFAVLCVDCLQWPCACSFEDDGGGL